MSPDRVDLESLTLEQCSSLVGERFLVRGGGDTPVKFDLVEAAPLSSRPLEAGSEGGFSLLFRGPPAPAFNQGILGLENDASGSLELFVVPVRSDERGVYYEAIINRLA